MVRVFERIQYAVSLALIVNEIVLLIKGISTDQTIKAAKEALAACNNDATNLSCLTKNAKISSYEIASPILVFAGFINWMCA